MATNPFPEWLAEVASDTVIVRPDDITSEARGNLWTFGLNAEQRPVVTPTDVEEFVRAVAAARTQWLTTRVEGPMWFYCWHDAQAGQLRFSLVSASHSALPFGCPVDSTAELSSVVRDFLGADTTGGEGSLPIWVITIP